MKKSNTNLILAISATVLVALLGFSLYFVNVIKNKNKHISLVAATLEKKIADKQNVVFLKKKMEDLSKTNDTLSSYIVDTSRIDLFVEYLEGIGVENNINLTVKNVEVLKNEKNKIFVSLSMNGPFINIMKAVVVLENSPYNIAIASSYINKDIVLPSDVITTTSKDKTTAPKLGQTWQADITFNILSI